MAATTPLNPQHVAVDTNVLIDLAEDNETVWEAVETIRRLLKGVRIVAPPTVVQELANLVENGETERVRTLALKAARCLSAKWKFIPINFIPVGHGITERIAERLRSDNLLPTEEVNDSLIVAESAYAGCTILLSSDRHICEIPADKLNLLLAGADVSPLSIASPRDIVRKFGR